MAVDWNRLALQEYTLAAENTRDVGEYLGEFIKTLCKLGIPLDKITLVGHRYVIFRVELYGKIVIYYCTLLVWVRAW